MPTRRRGEGSGWRSGIRCALFKVCAAFNTDWRKDVWHCLLWKMDEKQDNKAWHDEKLDGLRADL